jgi:hypothetical protein
MPHAPDDRWLDAKAAARIVGCAHTHLQMLALRGTIQYVLTPSEMPRYSRYDAEALRAVRLGLACSLSSRISPNLHRRARKVVPA